MKKRKCTRCNDDGYYYVAPHGVNPFNVRLPQLARIMEIRRCNCDLIQSDNPLTEHRGTL
jgi:hypothetical protein